MSTEISKMHAKMLHKSVAQKSIRLLLFTFCHLDVFVSFGSLYKCLSQAQAICTAGPGMDLHYNTNINTPLTEIVFSVSIPLKCLHQQSCSCPIPC